MKMKLLYILLGLLLVVDGVVTNHLITTDKACEGNLILMRIAGTNWLIVSKVLGALLCGYLLSRIAAKHPKAAKIATVSGIVFYTGIVGWNLMLV